MISVNIQTILILMLITFIIGMVVGISLVNPNQVG